MNDDTLLTLRQKAEHAAARANIARNDEIIAEINVLWEDVRLAWHVAVADMEAHRLACEALAGQINKLRAESREHVRSIYGDIDIDY